MILWWMVSDAHLSVEATLGLVAELVAYDIGKNRN